MNSSVHKKIMDTAFSLGAKDCIPILTRDIVLANWVRFKCQYGCPLYGRSFSCPPFSPTLEQTKKVLAEYDSALLVHFQLPAGKGSKNSFKTIAEAMLELEAEAHRSNQYKAFAYVAGPCEMCEECKAKVTNDPTECHHREKLRPSMESAGMDVFATAKNAGLELKVLEKGQDTFHGYALLLLE